MQDLSNRPFYTLMAHSSNAEKQMPKDMVVGHSNKTSSTTIDHRFTCKRSSVDSQPRSNTFNTVAIKMSKFHFEAAKQNEIVCGEQQTDI